MEIMAYFEDISFPQIIAGDSTGFNLGTPSPLKTKVGLLV